MGSGGSFLLHCIAGLETPDRGKIQIHGKTVYDSEKNICVKASERNVGYLFSDYSLFPHMTVEENVACAYRGKRKEKERIVESYIRKFDLEGLEDEYPSSLKDEQKQRTALARIMIREPAMLLLDEPLLGNPKEVLRSNLMRYLKEFQGGCILSSEDPENVFSICSWIAILQDGKLLGSGPREELFARPGNVQAARLTGVQNFSRVEILDEYHVRAVDWGIALRTEQKAEEGTAYVGIRSHLIKAVEEYAQNCMPVEPKERWEGVNSARYKVRNPECQESAELIWKSAPGIGMPPYLYFPPEDLMLLKE
jgi:molybdate transport system ATP-binding protein